MKTLSALQYKPTLFFIIPSLKGGGAERVLIALANHFNQLNCIAIIIALNFGEPGYIIEDGIEVIYLLDRKNDMLLYRGYYVLLTFFKLLSLLVKNKPTCVLSFITSANIWTGITCGITGTPYIVSERTSPKRTVNQFNYLLKRLAALLYRKAKVVVVGAKGVEDCLREDKAFKDLSNIHKITNSVPVFKPLTGQPVHHRKFILGVGRLEYVKGFDMLITAFANAQIKDTDLLIVGDGDERNKLVSLVSALGLSDRVIFTGAKSDLQDYYDQAELFVLPSRNEGYPNALVEAMSFGCPSIAMDCEFGPSEIIVNEHNGLLVQAANVADLTSAINRLMNNPTFRQDLGREAVHINDTNSPQQIFKKWEEVLLTQV